MNADGQVREFPHSQEDARGPSPPQPGSNCISFTASPGVSDASGVITPNPRREYRWSKAARDLVRANIGASGTDLSALVTQLVERSGYPRWACWRFVRRMGIRPKRPKRLWTQAERQRLQKLIDLHSVNEIARLLHRSQSSVWHMLYRMGASAAMGRDSFTKNSLAMALHVSPIQIEAWIKRGWLKAREVQTGSIQRVVIAAQDFCEFCRAHTRDAVGNRLIQARFDFVYQFAFSASPAELLPVRESKKERSAYQAQLKKEEAGSESGPTGAVMDDDEGDALERTA